MNLSRIRLKRLALLAVLLVPLSFVGAALWSLGDAEKAFEKIPAAVVNLDELTYLTAPDGTETPVFAGRQLVTELTGGDGGFDWRVAGEADAAAALERGEVYAVLTIPTTFSSDVLSLSSAAPRQAELGIVTNDAHSYLAGAVGELVTGAIADRFGSTVTATYVQGVLDGFGELSGALGSASDGAGALADGTKELSAGLGELAAGADAAGIGAQRFASGVTDYTRGVDALAAGLGQLEQGAAGLEQLGNALAASVSAPGGLLDRLDQALTALAADPADPLAQQELRDLGTELETAIGTGVALAPQLQAAVTGIRQGIAASADGAEQLSAGSAGLRGGAGELAAGLSGIASGVHQSADGAAALGDGMGELADGLATARGSLGEAPASDAADIIADPVTVSATTLNPIDGVGGVIATLFVPLGLWVGALAVFLVLRPVRRGTLVTTAPSTRLLRRSFARALAVTGAQLVPVFVLLHTVVGVPWSLAALSLLLLAVMASAFTALHLLLASAFGRAGLVLSVLMLAIQVIASAGILPPEALAGPFPAIARVFPLGIAASGMQALVTGSLGALTGPILALAGLGAASMLLSLWAVRRSRRARELALAA